MHKNNVLKDFLQKNYDEQNNYNSILSKVKGGIYMKKKILNIAAVIIVVLGVSIFAPKIYAKIAWNIDYKKYEEREISREKIAINELSENGFEEDIDMEYVYKDGVGAKIDSFMITTDYLKLDIDFKLQDNVAEEKTPEHYKTLSYGFAIYDENNNIYAVNETIPNKDLTYWKKLYKELNINSDLRIVLNDNESHGVKKINGNEATAKVEVMSAKGFPKAKKLFVRIFELGYVTFNRNPPSQEFQEISKNEWQFEIEIPERFYERTATELKFAKDVKNVTLKKAILSETGLTMKVKINGLTQYIAQIRTEPNAGTLLEDIAYITDEDNNLYIALDIGGESEDEQKLRFGIGKNQLNKRLFLHINLNDIHEVVELVK